MDGGVRKPPSVELSVLGQPEYDVCQSEASRLYGLGPTADTWGEPLPGLVECPPEQFHLTWIVSCSLNQLARLHSQSPSSPPPLSPHAKKHPARLPTCGVPVVGPGTTWTAHEQTLRVIGSSANAALAESFPKMLDEKDQ
jgi:hypothetical protein